MDEKQPIPGLNKQGRPVPHLMEDPGADICFCYPVTVGEMVEMIRREQSHRVAHYSKLCDAGIGCGSCRPDIVMLIEFLLEREADRAFD